MNILQNGDVWRKEALLRLPMFRQQIEEALDIAWLWTNLSTELPVAYDLRPVDGVLKLWVEEAVVSGIYAFARWCWNEADDPNVQTAVAGFYECLPARSPLVRQDMARWLALEEFQDLLEKGVFRYFLTAEEHEAFVQTFLERKGVRKPEVEKPLSRKAFVGISSRKRQS